MVRDIGVDLEDIRRFKVFIKKGSSWQRFFTLREMKYCKKYKDAHVHLAGKFCAKEAVMKAVGKKLPFELVEIRNEKSGRPHVFFKNKHLEISCSISHAGTFAIAVAISELKNKSIFSKY